MLFRLCRDGVFYYLSMVVVESNFVSPYNAHHHHHHRNRGFGEERWIEKIALLIATAKTLRLFIILGSRASAGIPTGFRGCS